MADLRSRWFGNEEALVEAEMEATNARREKILRFLNADYIGEFEEILRHLKKSNKPTLQHSAEERVFQMGVSEGVQMIRDHLSDLRDGLKGDDDA